MSPIDTMKTLWLFLTSLLILSACTTDDDYDPEVSFTKIYDSNQGDLDYYPIDLIETSAGFTVLTGQSTDNSDFAGVKLLFLDKGGNYLSETDLSEDYYIPIGKMASIDSVAYFFAMEPVTLRAVLIKAADTSSVEITPLAGLYYPLASNVTSANQLLLEGFDPENEQTYLALVSTSGTVTSVSGYDIGAGSDIEENIYNHYVDPERNGLPFFCGEWASGQYYFNGVYNYSLSLVFTNLSETPSGVVQGQGFNGGMTHILPLQGSNFVTFGFQYNDNFLVPSATLSTGDLSSSVDYMESPISEFRSRTPADMTLWEGPSSSYAIVAAETESRQVALYFYDAVTAELAAIHKIGYINPYTLASIRPSGDGGLLVLGSTYVGGRFQRVFLSKIDAGELKGYLH